MTAWLIAGAVCFTSPLFPSARWAFLATLALGAVPHSGEVFLILTNIQWPFAAALLLLAAEPVAQPPKRLRLGFAATAALTGPFCLLLSPLAIWRLIQCWRSHRRIDRLAVILLTGAAIQGCVILMSSSRATHAASADPGLLALISLIGVFPELFGTMAGFLDDIPLRLMGTLAGIAGLLYACSCTLPGYAERRVLLLGGGLILGAGLLLCLASHHGSPRAFGAGARYLYVPFVAFTWAMLLALARSERHSLASALPATLLLVLLFHATRHPQAPRYVVPNWKAAALAVKSGETVTFQIAPLDSWVTVKPRSASLMPETPGH